jgi:hypothetical protein
MKITYQDLNLKTIEIELKDAINLKINGIQIKEVHAGLLISTEQQIEVYPKASNAVVVKKGEF